MSSLPAPLPADPDPAAAPAASPFAGLRMPPPDVGLKFAADPNPAKIDLRAGIYHTDSGEVPKLAAVQAAEARLPALGLPVEYLPTEGLAGFNSAMKELAFGPSVSPDRVATVQTLGGSNALRLGAELLARECGVKRMLLSDPTWADHKRIFACAGMDVQSYPYLTPDGRALDFSAMLSRLASENGPAAVLVQASCHNPSGRDLGTAERTALVGAFAAARGRLIPFVDMAYQGLAEGIQEDAAIVRDLAQAGIPFLVASSCSKIFSLYSRRTGALSVCAASPAEAERVMGRLRPLARASHSSPPVDGAAIVAELLGDPLLRAAWETEIVAMRERVASLRDAFVDGLGALGHAARFQHLREQRGMFAYTGLDRAEVQRLQDDQGVYLLGNGRLCLTALPAPRIPSVCERIHRAISSP